MHEDARQPDKLRKQKWLNRRATTYNNIIR